MSKLQSVGGTVGKETIYVDVDDEITAIIDKVRSAKGKVIALVLPKRATVLQSIVNMKLLKRTADDAGKNLVLVTSEAGLMPLAGGVGLYVASTPTSRPEIPVAPAEPDDELEDAEEPLHIVDGNTTDVSAGDDFDPKAAGTKTLGELAGTGTGVAAGKTRDDTVDESIDMDDAESEPTDEAGTDVPIKPKKNRKLAVPNFDSFRKKLVLGVVVLALLITGWIFAFTVLPKASVAIKTDSSTVATNVDLVVDTTAKALNAADGIVPAVAQTQDKTSTQQVAATGQQNTGDKATGSVTVTAGACGPNFPNDISAGTTLSTGGHTYVLNDPVSFGVKNSGGHCVFASNGSVGISALKGGADYNVSSATFTITGQPANVSASGSTSGGTDNIIKVVAQGDIDNATNKIKGDATATVKQQLASALQAKGLQAIPSTFLAGDPQVTTSAKAGDTADTVTVTAVTSYTMLGVKKSDLATIVRANVEKQIDKSRQVILDDGVANAKITQDSPGSTTGANVSMSAKSVAGPQLDTAKLKTQIMGMKAGAIKDLIKQTPGVTDVQVKYSPFWVSSVPKKADKITITIDKPSA